MANELTVLPPRGVARAFDAEELVEEWRASMAERVAAGEMAQTTADTYARGMAAFLAWADDTNVERIGPRALRGWKASLLEVGRAPAGVNVLLAGVKAFFAWAVAERGLAYDPTQGVKGATRTGGRRHKRAALSDTEVLRVLAQPDTDTDTGKRDAAMLYLLAYTGVRTIEVQRARVGDLRTNGHTTLLIQGKGRVEADEAVYLVRKALLDAVYAWLAVHPRGHDATAPLFCGLGNRNRGGALTTRAIRGIVKRYYQAAGIRDPHKTTHSLRHTVVTNLIRHKVAPTKIMSVTRHKSLDTLLAYAHEVERDADPAEAYIDYGPSCG